MRENGHENPEQTREITGPEKIVRQMVFDLPQTPESKIPKNLKDLAMYLKNVRLEKISPHLESAEVKILPSNVYALIGPNGSAKSTFFNALTSDQESLKTSMLIRHGKAPSFRIARLLQETDLKPIEDLVVTEAIDQMASYYAYEDSAYQERPDYDPNVPGEMSERLSGLFGLNLKGDRASIKVGNLSGGEKTKLCLMVALMSNPDMLLLDEPNNHLDLSTTSMLTNMIDQLKAKGITVIFSSHSEDFIKGVNPDEIFSIAVDSQKRILTQKDFNPDSINLAGRSNPINTFNQRWGRYLGQKKLSATIDIHGNSVNLKIELGSPVCLLGKSGIGKTTLLEKMQEAVNDSSHASDWYASFAYLPQTWPEQIINGNLDTFFQWCYDTDDDNTESYAKAKKAFLKKLVDSGIVTQAEEGSFSQPFSRFSGGEQRLLWFIAIEAADKHNFLVLDEPTNHADKALKETIGNAIKNFTGNVMYTTHDIAFVKHMSVGEGRSKVQVLESAKDYIPGVPEESKLVISHWPDNFDSEDFQRYIENLNKNAARATKNLFD